MHSLTSTVFALPVSRWQWRRWPFQCLCLFLVSGGNNAVGQGYGEYLSAVLSSHARRYGCEFRGKYGCAGLCIPSLHPSFPHLQCCILATVNGSRKGHQQCINAGIDANALSWISHHFCVRECGRVTRLWGRRPVPVSTLRAVTTTARLILCYGADASSSLASQESPQDPRRHSRSRILLAGALMAAAIAVTVLRQLRCKLWWQLRPVTKTTAPAIATHVRGAGILPSFSSVIWYQNLDRTVGSDK